MIVTSLYPFCLYSLSTCCASLAVGKLDYDDIILIFFTARRCCCFFLLKGRFTYSNRLGNWLFCAVQFCCNSILGHCFLCFSYLFYFYSYRFQRVLIIFDIRLLGLLRSGRNGYQGRCQRLGTNGSQTDHPYLKKHNYLCPHMCSLPEQTRRKIRLQL